MKRREFITFLGGAVAAWPRTASAQSSGRLWKIGVLANEAWPPLQGLQHGLQDLGYIEGKSYLFVYRFAQGHAERFPALASELVNLPVDLIVAWGTPASLAAHKATDTIPIVMSAGDPVGAGIVGSLARPGGNLTGISVQMAEQEGKRLELLKKLLPSFSRVAVLSNPTNPYCAIAVGEARRGATALNLQFDLIEASDARNLEAAFLTLSRVSPDAVLVVADPFLAGERVRIADEMIKYKLPSVYSYHEHVRAGGLMTYTTNYYDVFRRQGTFIDKIFKGAKPGDLPVQQPVKFELMFNLRTAKTLGLTIPPTLLAIADEVIE
ncbi:MAG TPA: ABC transporter substrate-binding protein [Xanthobacteraceae bacterium]|jgi:putative ABC transport system substrate-binding protein